MKKAFQDKVVSFLEGGGEEPAADSSDPSSAGQHDSDGIKTVSFVNDVGPEHGPIIPEDGVVPEGAEAKQEDFAEQSQPEPQAVEEQSEPQQEPEWAQPLHEERQQEPEPQPVEEAPVEELPPEYDFDDSDQARYYLKADGQERVFSGSQIANTVRQSHTLERRFDEVKRKEAEIEAARQAQENTSRQLAARYLAQAGYIGPDGRILPPPGAGAPGEAVAEAQPSTGGEFSIPKYDLDQIDDDDLLGREFYERQNAQAEAMEGAFNAIASRLGNPAQGAAPLGEPAYDHQAAQIAEVEAKIRGSLAAHPVFASGKADIERGIDDVVGLMSGGNFNGTFEDAAGRIARVTAAEYDFTGSGNSNSGAVPAGNEVTRQVGGPRRIQPPAAGASGRTPPRRGASNRDRGGYSMGAMSAIERRQRLEDELKSRFSRRQE